MTVDTQNADLQAAPAAPASPEPQVAPAAVTQPQGQPDRIDPSQLSPEYQQHIDTLRKVGLFAQADQVEKMATRLETLEKQLNSVQGNITSSEQSKIDEAVETGKNLAGEILLQDFGFKAEGPKLQRITDSLISSITEDSWDAKGVVKRDTDHWRYLNGDLATRKEIVKKHLGFLTEFGEAFAAKKNASYAKDKAAAMAAQPKSVPAGASAPNLSGKRLSPSELRQGLLARLSVGETE